MGIGDMGVGRDLMMQRMKLPTLLSWLPQQPAGPHEGLAPESALREQIQLCNCGRNKNKCLE